MKSGAGMSALAGRTQRAAPAPIHRAPGNSFMSFIRTVFRKIASVFPAASRLGGSSEETMQHARQAALVSYVDAIAFEAHLRGKLIARGNATIDTHVDRVLADVANRAHREPESPLAQLAHNAFVNAESTLLSLRRDEFVHLQDDASTSATLFVAAGLGRLATQDRHRVIRTLSVNDLSRIADLDASSASRGTAGAVLLAREEVSSRRERLTAAFAESAAVILARESAAPSARQNFASDLHQFAQALHKLQAFCDARGERLPDAALPLRSELAARLHECLEGNALDLAALSPREIAEVRAELRMFGIELDAAQLAAAADKRLPEIEQDCRDAVSRVLHGAHASSPEAVLRGLKDMERHFDTLRDTRNAFLQDLKSAQDVFNLRQKVFAEAIAELPAGQRAAICAKLGGTSMLDLRETIYSLGDSAGDARRDKLSSRLNRLGSYLEELGNAAAPQTGPALRSPGSQLLSTKVQEAFSAVFHIRWTASGNAVFDDCRDH